MLGCLAFNANTWYLNCWSSDIIRHLTARVPDTRFDWLLVGNRVSETFRVEKMRTVKRILLKNIDAGFCEKHWPLGTCRGRGPNFCLSQNRPFLNATSFESWQVEWIKSEAGVAQKLRTNARSCIQPGTSQKRKVSILNKAQADRVLYTKNLSLKVVWDC